MKHTCEVVKDLLPLYHDGVCSEASNEIVRAHLEECDSCREELWRMDDDVVDMRLQQERQGVIARHTDHVKAQVKKRSFAVGIGSAAVFAIPILVCLIVNLATSRALDWFFIVLTALGVLASLTVVPILVPRKRALWTLGSFVVSLHLLLMTCCIYTCGDWFWVASVSVLLGLTVLVLPCVIRQVLVKGALSRHKGLLVMLMSTGLLFLLLFVIGLYAGGRYVAAATYWRNVWPITMVCLPLPWVLFVVIHYLPMTKRGKTGLSLVLCGAFCGVINDVIRWILEGGALRLGFENVDYLHWTLENTNDNSNLLISLVLIVAGVFLLAIQGKRKTKQ